MSQAKSEAARANGAKSQGPVTPEGKARSSRNSLRHGFRSETVVLPHEDASHFEQLRDSYVDDLQPANQSQLDLVDTMAAARWRLNRLVTMESCLFEQELARTAKTIDEEFTGMDDTGKLAWTLNKMVNTSKTPAHLLRYESQLNRSYDLALKQLQTLQKMAQAAALEQRPNEPKPEVLPAGAPQPNEPSAPDTTPKTAFPPSTPPPNALIAGLEAAA
jgi:hypothetical protein